MTQHETRPDAISLSHTAIARRYFLPIAGTLVLLAGENIAMVVTPYLLGDAIDGLLATDTRALWIFGLVSLAGLAIGILRRVYDTRAYGRIYRELATETISKELRHEAPVSQMTARANFVSEFVEYFEIMLPAALTYVLQFTDSMIILPYTYQQFLRTREIGTRLERKGGDRSPAGADVFKTD